MKKIVLVVDNIDIDDEATDVACTKVRPALWMRRDGITTVTYITDAEPVSEAIQLASEIETRVPGARVSAWYPDLVGVAQIAQRIGVTAEAVRLWATGKRGHQTFPTPLGRVGAGEKTSPVWRWADVANWLASALSLDVDEHFPTRSEIASIDAELASGVGSTSPAVTYSPSRFKRVVASRAATINMKHVASTERQVSAVPVGGRR